MGLPSPRNIHGRSLAPLWKGSEKSAHAEVFSGDNYEGLDRLVMMRTPEWKLTRYDDGGGELYNLADDPSELDNRIEDPKYAAVVQRLTKRLEKWDRDCPHVAPQISASSESRNPERARKIRAAFAKWSGGRGDALVGRRP